MLWFHRGQEDADPIHDAAEHGDVATVQQLLRAGANGWQRRIQIASLQVPWLNCHSRIRLYKKNLDHKAENALYLIL